MSLPRFSVRRPVTTIMIYLGVVLLGVIAWTRLPQELFPPITYPQLTVVTHYRDAAPEEIEILITKPIEEVVGTVSGLRRVSSVSKEELSLVIAEFNWGKKMDQAGLDVREKLDLIKGRLPRGSEDPVVIKFNPFELPVLVLNVSADRTPHELLELARKQIKTELEKVEGVAAANISGGLDREILVEVDQGRLQASGIPISQVVDAIGKANWNYPAGTIKEAFYEYLIRTIGEFQVVPEIQAIAVGVEETKSSAGRQGSGESDRPLPLRREKGVAPAQRMILLKDVASVKDTFKEKTSISRFNGQENISLRVQKQTDANTLQVATRVKENIRQLQASLPKDVRLNIAYDQSLFIRDSIAGVRDAAVQGGILAFLVLLAFLGNPWAALNVALAIPISILATIGLMYFSGTSINVVSLGGLAFGVGLLVDAGVVVVENIERYRAQNVPAREAAVRGTQEVASAILGTVLTTVVVFLPMVFVVGIAGQLFKDLAYTITFSNFASLAVSLTLTALLASRIRTASGRSPLDSFVRLFLRADTACVRWFLSHRLLGIGMVVLLFVGSVFSLTWMDREMLPRTDQGQFILRVNLPPGTRLEVTDRMSKRIERVLGAMPEVQDVTVTIGSSKERRAEELLETLGSHQAQILVGLKPRSLRVRKTTQVVQELKETLGREPLEAAEVEYLLSESVFKSSFLAGAPVVVEIKGTDLARLQKLAEEVQKNLEKIPGLYGVQSSLVAPSPETKVHVMKDRAAAYHLSVNEIALTAQTALKGVVSTKFKQEGKEIDIRVRLRPEDRMDMSRVRRLLVHSPLDVDVPLAEVSYFAVGTGPTEVRHMDQQRSIVLSAQVFGRAMSDLLEEVRLVVEKASYPAGYSVSLTGESQQIQESFQSLAFALILSVILVYMVMASEFESLWQPFLIMGTIPMSLAGVAVALWVTHTPVSVMVVLGFITLGGIVVDNGIVFVDYVNLLRDQGISPREAVLEASRTRLRPILMTAATTVLGLLPLALGLGEGTELQMPMAITVMGGLTMSTFLTLIFLPVIYATGAEFFERFHPVQISTASEPTPALVPAGLAVPMEEIIPAVSAPELPEVPEGFGGEEAVPVREEIPFALGLESLAKPEPSEETLSTQEQPAISETPPAAPVPTLGEPIFEEAPPETPETAVSSKPELNPRQKQLLAHLRVHSRVTRKEYVEMTGASIPTAARDLKELVDRGLIRGVGPLGPGRHYVLA